MISIKNGWVVVKEVHPEVGESFIWFESFRRTRTEAIAEFIKDSGDTWENWKRKHHYKCVKAESIIRTGVYN